MSSTPEIRGRLAISIRRLAKEGYALAWIARRHNLDPEQVQAFLRTVPEKVRRARDPTREIRGRLAKRVRKLLDAGIPPADIAADLHLDSRRVNAFARRYQPVRGERITRPRTRREQQALDRNQRARQRRQARAPKPFVDEWKAAAATDPSYRDPVDALVVPLEAPVILPQISAELGIAFNAELPNVVAESWGSPHGSGSTPRKITEAVLTEALALHQAGWSWPAIARKFGCHRMAFYHAMRR